MITRKEKEQIFALYWGQCAMKETKFQNSPVCLICETFITECEQWHLELKPLASISNEDATECGFRTCTNEDSENYGMTASGCFVDAMSSTNFYGMLDLYATDHLRSRGYALPAFGHSVDELVKEGVFKLIKP